MNLSELKPTNRHRVYDLVREAGLDVSDWPNYRRSEEPAMNPKYCYNWVFKGTDRVVLCLWHEEMQQDETIRDDAAVFHESGEVFPVAQDDPGGQSRSGPAFAGRPPGGRGGRHAAGARLAGYNRANVNAFDELRRDNIQFFGAFFTDLHLWPVLLQSTKMRRPRACLSADTELLTPGFAGQGPVYLLLPRDGAIFVFTPQARSCGTDGIVNNCYKVT